MKRCLAALLILHVMACTLTPAPPQPTHDPAAYQQNHLPERWRLDGRLFFSNGDSAGIVKLRWLQDHVRYALQLTAPLGGGTYVLHGDGEEAYLLSPDNTVLRTTNLDDLLRQSLGTPLPVGALQYWVRGLAAPDSPVTHEQFGADGRIVNLAQAGWNIEIKHYREVDGVTLPDKIFMQNENIKLKFVIHVWDLHP